MWACECMPVHVLHMWLLLSKRWYGAITTRWWWRECAHLRLMYGMWCGVWVLVQNARVFALACKSASRDLCQSNQRNKNRRFIQRNCAPIKMTQIWCDKRGIISVIYVRAPRDVMRVQNAERAEAVHVSICLQVVRNLLLSKFFTFYINHMPDMNSTTSSALSSKRWVIHYHSQ